MSLIKSISGIRGTIGGISGDNLTPLDIVSFTAAFCDLLSGSHENKIVVGRDARISGQMVSNLVESTAIAKGFDVIQLGLATTPTTEQAVKFEKAAGGIIITASHNPGEWNALKLLNNKGEFISAQQGKELLNLVNINKSVYSSVDELGKVYPKPHYLEFHITEIAKLGLVDIPAIKSCNFTVAIDGINSVGGPAIIKLLKHLGVSNIIELNTEATGHFTHDPEPLEKNLQDLIHLVKGNKVDLGIAVDPDADRLCFISENGSFFGEEYTLVSIADYILQNQKGNVVSNLSSTRALRDLAVQHGVDYYASAVGEVNVVEKMKETAAIIGGEGNGGIIYPELHYGRDALVGIALFLSFMAKFGLKASEIRAKYKNYVMRKDKLPLVDGLNADEFLMKVKNHFTNENITTIDGVKVDFEKGWLHFRKSNTEPIIRIYAEAENDQQLDELMKKVDEIMTS